MSEQIIRNPQIPIILITGGPGAGKTESKNTIVPALEKAGYAPIFISETATELITSGISADTVGNYEYQKEQLRRQIKKENEAFRKAEDLLKSHQKPVIICDRGILDGIAWSDEKQFDELLESECLHRKELIDRYNAVFHMESAACRSASDYDQSNNEARIATVEEACRLDHILAELYKPNTKWPFIASQKDPQAKMNKLAALVLQFLVKR